MTRSPGIDGYTTHHDSLFDSNSTVVLKLIEIGGNQACHFIESRIPIPCSPAGWRYSLLVGWCLDCIDVFFNVWICFIICMILYVYFQVDCICWCVLIWGMARKYSSLGIASEHLIRISARHKEWRKLLQLLLGLHENHWIPRCHGPRGRIRAGPRTQLAWKVPDCVYRICV